MSESLRASRDASENQQLQGALKEKQKAYEKR